MTNVVESLANPEMYPKVSPFCQSYKILLILSIKKIKDTVKLNVIANTTQLASNANVACHFTTIDHGLELHLATLMNALVC